MMNTSDTIPVSNSKQLFKKQFDGDVVTGALQADCTLTQKHIQMPKGRVDIDKSVMYIRYRHTTAGNIDHSGENFLFPDSTALALQGQCTIDIDGINRLNTNDLAQTMQFQYNANNKMAPSQTFGAWQLNTNLINTGVGADINVSYHEMTYNLRNIFPFLGDDKYLDITQQLDGMVTITTVRNISRMAATADFLPNAEDYISAVANAAFNAIMEIQFWFCYCQDQMPIPQPIFLSYVGVKLNCNTSTHHSQEFNPNRICTRQDLAIMSNESTTPLAIGKFVTEADGVAVSVMKNTQNLIPLTDTIGKTYGSFKSVNEANDLQNKVSMCTIYDIYPANLRYEVTSADATYVHFGYLILNKLI